MDNKKNLSRGIIAAGAGITAAALRELLLSKEEHDKKEREINRLEKDKEKYMKKIGTYEPFDIEKGNVTPNDSKLVNLLTRAVGVAFTNDDVFSRNKSNVRTFPFIISNNSSINATIEVELRKYYEVMVASQVANLINHTVFAAENILNVKDGSMRSVDKVIDKLLTRQPDLADLGNSLQRGIYEDLLFEQDGEILSLNESYESTYVTLDQYINDYQRIIKDYTSNPGEKARLIKSMDDIRQTRSDLMSLRRGYNAKMNYTLKVGEQLTADERVIESNVQDLFGGKLSRQFDGLESEETVQRFKEDNLTQFRQMGNKYINARELFGNLVDYLDGLEEYHMALNRGLSILTNNNFSDPVRGLADTDPYYRLLDLPRVDNYVESSELLMRMFKNSTALKVKLEMAAALLISTEILPFEFIEYATKYLNLPMHNKTKLAINMKYGMGTESSPFRFMGNNYVLDKATDVLRFYEVMRPNEVANKKELVKKLTKKQLKADAFNIFDFFRDRKGLEKRWLIRHQNDIIDKRLAGAYESSAKIDSRKRLKKIDNAIVSQSKSIHATAKNMADSIASSTNSASGDMMFGKSLSMLGAGGERVNRLIEDRLKNKIVDLYSVKDVSKSLEYFLGNKDGNQYYDPTSTFKPNLTQTQKLIQSIMNEGFEDDEIFITVLTEDLVTDLTEKSISESSYVYNISQPVRSVTYKEVTKDPIEYILPAYTKGRSLLYGSTEIDQDQFKNRKVGEPIWIKVTFSDKINSMKTDITDNDFTTVIGIKSEVHRVSEKDITNVLKKPTSPDSEVASIFRDQKNRTLGLITKIASENDLKSATLNGILIAAINEATTNIATKPSEDYINNPKLATLLRKTYNLSSLCLVDPIAEEYFIMEENSNSWSRLPFSELRASGSNSDIKALASMMGRR